MTNDQMIETLCDTWQKVAMRVIRKNPAFPPLVIAETMFSAAVQGWITLVGEKRVAHHLYLLALHLAKIADAREQVQSEARQSTQH